MKVLLIILAFTGAAIIDIPKLIKEKQWKEFIVTSGMLSIGLVLSILEVIGITIPNPNKGIEFIINFFKLE